MQLSRQQPVKGALRHVYSPFVVSCDHNFSLTAPNTRRRSKAYLVLNLSLSCSEHETKSYLAMTPTSQSKSTHSTECNGLELFIPPCVNRPRHCLHPPPPERPLRIRIQGPLETIQKLLPSVPWHPIGSEFPHPGGPQLAHLTHQTLYPGMVDTTPMVRDEYLAWIIEAGIPQE